MINATRSEKRMHGKISHWTLALSLTLIGLVSGIAWMSGSSGSCNSGDVSAHVGGSWVAAATSSGLLNVTSDDLVGQDSVIGNFTIGLALEVQMPPPESQEPAVATGQETWTTADGKSTLTLSLTGFLVTDKANPLLFNAQYEGTVISGTGKFAGAIGKTHACEVGKFVSTTTGISSLIVTGHIRVPRPRDPVFPGKQ